MTLAPLGGPLEWLTYAPDPDVDGWDWEEALWQNMSEQARWSRRTRLYDQSGLRVYTAWFAGATPQDGIAFSLFVLRGGEAWAHEWPLPVTAGGLAEAHNFVLHLLREHGIGTGP